MSEEAKRIRKNYMEPPLKEIYYTWVENRTGSHAGDEWEIQTKIWVDQHLPEYRVAIPAKRSFDDNGKDMPDWFALPMKYITYVPTGRVVYDNSGFSLNPIVYEYILETMLGKKDLRHYDPR